MVVSALTGGHSPGACDTVPTPSAFCRSLAGAWRASVQGLISLVWHQYWIGYT